MKEAYEHAVKNLSLFLLLMYKSVQKGLKKQTERLPSSIAFLGKKK